mgnify:CR=1 FL=1
MMKALISIHAPRVGRDRQHGPGACLPCISIHAPRVGRDKQGYVSRVRENPISIHAPRVGRDTLKPS